LTGLEQFTIDLPTDHLHVGQEIVVHTSTGKTFNVTARLDTDVEIAYYENGGILQYVLRKLAH
jgi:aconitate hydratase